MKIIYTMCLFALLSYQAYSATAEDAGTPTRRFTANVRPNSALKEPWRGSGHYHPHLAESLLPSRPSTAALRETGRFNNIRASFSDKRSFPKCGETPRFLHTPLATNPKEFSLRFLRKMVKDAPKGSLNIFNQEPATTAAPLSSRTTQRFESSPPRTAAGASPCGLTPDPKNFSGSSRFKNTRYSSIDLLHHPEA